MSVRALLRRTLLGAGLDPGRLIRSMMAVPGHLQDRRRFKQTRNGDEMSFGPAWPCLGDRGEPGGDARGHYFHQDLLVARRIFAAAPPRHLDVGSRVDGFVAHVASFREIEVIDIRPVTVQVPQIRFIQADLMRPVPPDLVASTTSLSCLHALEHFGLGRYGDPIDPDGHLRGIANLATLLAPGGTLYLSVPIGPSRVEFNAHRVFALPHLLRLTETYFHPTRLSYVDDAGDLHEDVPWEGPAAGASFGCQYGCGILEMIRTETAGDAHS